MAIATAVIGDGGAMSAVHALIKMAAESSSTTPRNRSQHFDVLPTEPLAVSFDERRSWSGGDWSIWQCFPALQRPAKQRCFEL
jgi:hypothetical protein